MKKTLSRILVLLMLAAIMTGFFAGCGTDEGDGWEALPSQAPVTDAPPTDKAYTINIMTQRHEGYDNDPNELWFFNYMEYWFAQQGYNVTINVEQSNDMNQTKNLALNTDSLPDLMWSVNLKNEEVVRYAMEQNMILEWTPYINETLMPNLTKRMAEEPTSRSRSTAPNGGIYGLPYYAPSQYASGCYGVSERLYFRQSWLDAAGVQNPTTKEEFLNVLRAFKTKITDPSADKQDVPLVSSDTFLEKYLWTCMGFYGTEPGRFGTNLMLDLNNNLVVPAYTDSYTEFVSTMKTMYDEGLIAKDYFTTTSDKAGALMSSGKSGALAWFTLEYVGNQFADIVCANPIPMGNVTDVNQIHVSRLESIYPNYIWASSKYEEPRILAMLVDYVYGVHDGAQQYEGAWLYRYGPQENRDPLGQVDGWYFDEKGDVTTKQVANGTRTSMSDYGRLMLFPNDYAGLRPAVVTSGTGEMKEFTDSVTGETYTCIDNLLLTHDNNDGHWRLITIEKWSAHATSIRIPDAYMGSDVMDEYVQLKTAINNWINNETVKFITGKRPMSEIANFRQELEGLGMARYLEIIQGAYAGWLAETFNK